MLNRWFVALGGTDQNTPLPAKARYLADVLVQVDGMLRNTGIVAADGALEMDLAGLYDVYCGGGNGDDPAVFAVLCSVMGVTPPEQQPAARPSQTPSAVVASTPPAPAVLASAPAYVTSARAKIPYAEVESATSASASALATGATAVAQGG